MIKLVAMDMDGTLLNSLKLLPDENRITIEEYAKKGIEFAFCTGRVMNELELISGELPSVKYAITCNGAYVRDINADNSENEIFCDTLTAEDVRNLYYTIEDMNVKMMFELQADGVVYAERYCINHTEEYGVGYIKELIKETRVPLDDMKAYLAKRTKDIGKVNIFFPSTEIRNKVLNQLKDVNYDLSYSEPTNIEFNKVGTNKGKGVKRLAEYLGVDMSEVMVIGDNYNDVEMLKVTENSVVMANADDEIKSYANFVTLTNDESGVAHAIRKFC